MTKLCDYGCGLPAKHTTKGSAKKGQFQGRPVHQCSKSANTCPAIKQKKIISSREKYGTDYPWQIESIIEKRGETNVKKYGHKCSLLNNKVQEKRKKTMIEKYDAEEPMLNNVLKSKAALSIKQKHQNDPSYSKRIIATRQEKYGEDYASILDKSRKTRIKNGDWVDSSNIRLWKNYKRKVRYHTQKNYKKYNHIINPKNLQIGKFTYHLDHIFSRKEGFDKNIDPKIISHPANLQVIDAKTNRKKYTTSGQTLESLYEKINKWEE